MGDGSSAYPSARFAADGSSARLAADGASAQADVRLTLDVLEHTMYFVGTAQTEEDGTAAEHSVLALLRLKSVSRAFATACRRTLNDDEFLRLVSLEQLMELDAPVRAFRARAASSAGQLEALVPDPGGMLCFHRALEARCSDEVVLALLAASPCETASQTCGVRQLPLHFAAAYGASVHVIERLIADFPPGAAHRARGGRLPLHLACLSRAPAG
eukprot:707695-Prymnesium_polylepis.1